MKDRRYQELLEAFNPEDTVRSQEHGLSINRCSGLNTPLRDMLLRHCVPLVEALAGTGQHERALALAKNILRVVRRSNVRQMLIEAAKRGGDDQLARALDRTQRENT